MIMFTYASRDMATNCAPTSWNDPLMKDMVEFLGIVVHVALEVINFHCGDLKKHGCL